MNGKACALIVSVVLCAGSARGDECASYGPEPFLTTPANGTTIAQSVRFEVNLFPSCGAVEGGPAHELRLLAAGSKPIDTTITESEVYPGCKPVPCKALVLTPKILLPAGQRVQLLVRNPRSTTSLGPWEEMASFTVAGRTDRDAPEFEGIESARAMVVEGSAPISPCQAVPAWQLRIRFVFRLARDGQTDPDELLYRLWRSEPSSGQWESIAQFRPSEAQRSGRGQFDWRDPDGWARTRLYRIEVTDASGNRTLGSKLATVAAPARPTGAPSPGGGFRRAGMEPRDGAAAEVTGLEDDTSPPPSTAAARDHRPTTAEDLERGPSTREHTAAPPSAGGCRACAVGGSRAGAPWWAFLVPWVLFRRRVHGVRQAPT